MSSRFNTLYLGEPDEAAEALENFDGVSSDEIDANELRIALINALRRIDVLEQRLDAEIRRAAVAASEG